MVRNMATKFSVLTDWVANSISWGDYCYTKGFDLQCQFNDKMDPYFVSVRLSKQHLYLFVYAHQYRHFAENILFFTFVVVIKGSDLLCMYLHVGQDVTQGQFLSRAQMVSIQSFLFPKLVVLPKLKNSVCPTIYT